MICPDDYSVVMIPFPGDILAAVRVDADGYPTIYVNDYLTAQAKREAVAHELRHISNGDFSNHLTIFDVERQAAHTEPFPSVMLRSWRDLTSREAWGMIFAGVVLTYAPFMDGPTFDEPLPMPPPLFATEPDRYLFREAT